MAIRITQTMIPRTRETEVVDTTTKTIGTKDITSKIRNTGITDTTTKTKIIRTGDITNKIRDTGITDTITLIYNTAKAMRKIKVMVKIGDREEDGKTNKPIPDYRRVAR
uniref:Uncharacterized protein n=1 Tax=Cacopsylla melanoneura TaxID=428564 RepID=A0A8D9EW72_9HEMI